MDERGPVINPQDVEELWRGRLAAAKASYESAVTRFRTASEDFRSRHTPSPDGGFNVHLAIAAESSARKEYMRVLRLFTDLVLYGKIPEETDSIEKPGTGASSSCFPRKSA
jgi:hypothetical protein